MPAPHAAAAVVQHPSDPAPPPGLVHYRGRLLPRRHGLVRPRDLTCIAGHRIRIRGTPFEVAIPCTHPITFTRDGECGARVYVISMRLPGVVWYTDLTQDEETEINRLSLGPSDIITYLGLRHARSPRC